MTSTLLGLQLQCCCCWWWWV